MDPFGNVRAIIDLLYKVLPDTRNIDKHMINNERICTRKKGLELDYANIKIDPKHFDTTFITVYKNTADTFKIRVVILFVYLFIHRFCKNLVCFY